MGVSSQQVVTLGATPSLLFLSPRAQCRTRWLTGWEAEMSVFQSLGPGHVFAYVAEGTLRM